MGEPLSGDERPRAEASRGTDRAFGRGGSAILSALAVVAIVAEVSSRGVAPALPGVWVGATEAIAALEMVSAVSSQLFAVASTAIVIGLVLATVKSKQPAGLRAFSVGVGVLTILAVMIASAVKLPSISRIVLALGASALALVCARLASRYFTSRAAALVCATTAGAGIVRVATILLAGQVADGGEVALGVAVRIGATASMALTFVAVVVAMVWTARVPRAALERVGRWLALGAVGATVGVLVGMAQLGSDPEASGAPLLVARTFDALAPRPQSYGPVLLFVAGEALRWLAALAVLVVGPYTRAMAAVVALALVAGGILEVPLCAAALVIASLALALHPGPDLRRDTLPT